MFIHLLIFIFGLIILLPSTGTLVKISKLLANKLKISPLITGVTLVALGTSLPELAVSTTAAIRSDYGLALGNIIGSNIINILLVFPIGVVIGSLRIGTTKTQKTALIMTGASFLFYFLHLINFRPLLSAVILLSTGIFITFLEYIWGFKGGANEDTKRVQEQSFHNGEFKLSSFILLLLSLVGIVIGGLLIVSATEAISIISGYSTTILGLSLTAIATSLPELLTTIFSQQGNDEKLTLGNIIGSNIYNLTLIGGISAFFSFKIDLPVTDWLWFIASTLILLLVIKLFKKNVVPRFIGLTLLVLFVFYIVTLPGIQ